MTGKQDLLYIVYLLKHSSSAIVGLFLILVIVCIAIFAPLIATHNPYKIDISNGLQSISRKHLFGTDVLGRDIFSRVIYGSRISLRIAFLAVSIATVTGTLVGAVSGYIGGTTDIIVMRIVDVFLSIPTFVLAMVGAAVLGPSINNLMLALCLVLWTWYARIARGEVLKIKNTRFILAVQALGASHLRILIYHLLPNSIAPIIVQATVQLGYVVLTSAGLSFLGIGAQPPAPSWGLMVSSGRYYLPDHWEMVTFPGLAIFCLVMGFMLVGDTVRDIVSREIV